MSAPSPRPSIRPASLGLLAVPAAILGALSAFPDGLGVLVALGAVTVAVVLRSWPNGSFAAWAPVPVVLGLAVATIAAPVGMGVELVAGLSGLAFLVWLADDPHRPTGGAVRGLPTVMVAGLALGIAWTSALFLPGGSVPLGVAGALLAWTLIAVALLVGRPSLFDREEG